MKKLYIFIPIILLLISISATAQTHIWTGNGGDTDWFNVANWDAGTIPDNTSDVLISNASVDIITGEATVNNISLELSASLHAFNNLSLSENFSISPDSQFVWEKGTLNGGGTIVNDGTFIWLSLENKASQNITIENNATFSIEDTNLVNLSNTIITNNFTGEILISSSGGFFDNGAGNSTLNNNGFIEKQPNSNGDPGNFYLVLDVNNSGIIEVAENQTFLNLGGSLNFINMDDGILQGNGTFDITGMFMNTGTLSPGNPSQVGTLKMLNNIDLIFPGKLEININGLLDYDVLQLFGSPNLTGDIEVNLGYNAEINDEFTILTTSNGINSCNFPSQISAAFGSDSYIFDVICHPNNIILKANTILATEDFNFSNRDFFVYPNPVKDVASVYFKNSEIDFSSDILSVTVYNMLGQKVKVFENFSEKNNSFDINKLQSGMYFLQLKEYGKTIASTKMIVE